MRPQWREAAKVALIYALFGVLWIQFSDDALLWLVRDPERLTQMQTYKGWAFVVITATLLYGLVLASLKRLHTAEARSRQLEKFEALGQMAGGLAHDFNNVLTVVLGTVELARLGLEPGSESSRHLADLEAAAGRGQGLVKRLMAYARREPVQPRPLDLADSVQQCRTLLRRLLKPSVTLETELQSAWALGDPLQLEQVLMNLVSNADDAMPSGGRLWIGCGVDGEQAWLKVVDNGHGMPDSVRTRVFETFFSTKGERGTGLGLATVFGIVQQMQGSIDLQSQPGQGSRFTLRFPRIDVPAALGKGPAQA